MNELQRQAYLSALGIENYAPRWLLPCAPVPVVCVLPLLDVPVEPVAPSPPAIFAGVDGDIPTEKKSSPNLLNALAELSEQKKAPMAVNAATILRHLEGTKAPAVQPFSLSVYRPQPEFLIVDSRNTQLALPTDLFLHNLLRAHLKSSQIALNDEVLRWPLIENQFVSRTEADARNELQTWLAVENELRPVSKLWLMGENAARYWLTADCDWSLSCWTAQPIDGLQLTASVLPSLNELLQKPILKAQLWAYLP